jgi:hypothetical protein
MLGDPSLPKVFVSLGVTRGKLDVLRECRLRQLKHALIQKLLVSFQRGEHAENVFGRDVRVGDFAGEEDTLAKGRVGVDVEVFLVLGIGARG